MRSAQGLPSRIAVGIDMAIASLNAAESDAVLRVVGLWEQACWMSAQEAAEWRRRIFGRRLLMRFLPVRTLVLTGCRSTRPRPSR